MAQQTIGIGAAPNDGTGDPIRDAFDKCNDNFTELYAGLTGLLDFKGSTDCSTNPNYPAASKGDFYVVSVAGKIGGASGTDVEVGDAYFAEADNAGGTQAAVGTDWSILQGNTTGAGAGVDVQDETTPVLTASTLNFTGAGVVATDAGGGVATITIAGGGISGIDVEDEGVAEATGATTLNFTGAGVTAADVGGGVVDVTIPGGGGAGYESGPAGSVPTAATFATWINQGTSTLTDGVDALIFQPQRGAPATRYAMIGATPAAPFDLYMRFEMVQNSQLAATAFSHLEFGFALKDNADDEVIFTALGMIRIAGDEQVYNFHSIRRMNGVNSQTISATPVSREQLNSFWPWMRVNVTAATITFYISPDGKNWVEIGAETITTFVDTVDRYGIGAYVNDAGAGVPTIIVSYFGTTAPS